MENTVRSRLADGLARIGRFLYGNKAYILSFVLPCFVLFVAYMLFGVYPISDKSILTLDLNAQYVYYYDHMHDVLAGKEGLFYSWGTSLSGEFFGTFAYYLMSPFSLIVMAFPRTMVIEGIFAMILAKVACIGCSCSVLLKCHKEYSDLTSVMFSLAYALSAYPVANTINPMWLDGMIALPLVVMGVERICLKRKFLLYVLSLFYIFMANFYIGYMVGIFSALYFLYFMLSKRYTGRAWRSVATYGAASVTAIFMSCWLIVPMYESLQLGKVNFGDKDFTPKLNFDIIELFIKLFPGSYDTTDFDGLPMVYCGTFGLLCAILYFMSKRVPLRQKALGGSMFAVLIISMYVKPLDMFWHGGMVPVSLPYRYSFLFTFFIVLFGSEAFEHISTVKVRSVAFASAGAMSALSLAVYFADGKHLDLLSPMLFFVIMSVTVTGLVALYKRARGYRAVQVLIVTVACGELLLNSVDSLNKIDRDYYYSTQDSYYSVVPLMRETADKVKSDDDGFYRIESASQRCPNDVIAAGMYGVSHSSSLFNGKSIQMLSDLGFSASGQYSRYDGATMLTDDILGIRYVFSNGDGRLPYDGVPNAGTGVTVHENPDAFGIAYLADRSVVGTAFPPGDPFGAQFKLASGIIGEETEIFCPVEDYAANAVNVYDSFSDDGYHLYSVVDSGNPAYIDYRLTVACDGALYAYFPSSEEKSCGLSVNGAEPMSYLMGRDCSIAYLGNFGEGDAVRVRLTFSGDSVGFNTPSFMVCDAEALKGYSDRVHGMNSDTSVSRAGNSGLSVIVNAGAGEVLFTTIPYEPGWTATVDGDEIPIYACANDTFMYMKIPEGRHTVEMSFKMPGFGDGLFVSICGVVMLVCMLGFSYFAGGRKDSGDDGAGS